MIKVNHGFFARNPSIQMSSKKIRCSRKAILSSKFSSMSSSLSLKTPGAVQKIYSQERPINLLAKGMNESGLSNNPSLCQLQSSIKGEIKTKPNNPIHFSAKNRIKSNNFYKKHTLDSSLLSRKLIEAKPEMHLEAPTWGRVKPKNMLASSKSTATDFRNHIVSAFGLSEVSSGSQSFYSHEGKDPNFKAKLLVLFKEFKSNHLKILSKFSK